MVGSNKNTRKRKRHSIKKNTPNYNSGNGFVVNIWGPVFWFALHTMSFNYPVNPTYKNKKTYMDFILNLQYVLPCGKCRENLLKNFKELPLTMDSMKNRETFSRYIYNLHNNINKMLNKNVNITYEEVRDRYENFRAKSCKKMFSSTIKSKKNHEKGCLIPLNLKKSKSIIKIIPKDTNCDGLQIDKKCVM
jgi:hypothetical protein